MYFELYCSEQCCVIIIILVETLPMVIICSSCLFRYRYLISNCVCDKLNLLPNSNIIVNNS